MVKYGKAILGCGLVNYRFDCYYILYIVTGIIPPSCWYQTPSCQYFTLQLLVLHPPFAGTIPPSCWYHTLHLLVSYLPVQILYLLPLLYHINRRTGGGLTSNKSKKAWVQLDPKNLLKLLYIQQSWELEDPFFCLYISSIKIFFLKKLYHSQKAIFLLIFNYQILYYKQKKFSVF